MLGLIPASWFGSRRASPPPVEPLQSTYITEAFRRYIQNDIPARLIDTSKLTFIERDDVYDAFSTEIARITEEDVQQRIGALVVNPHPEAGNYVSARKAALQEAIRDVVKYAIFSHRWMASEPSYQDVSAVSLGGLGKYRNTKAAGIAKLLRLCDTARALGYKFVWSDTCCIDKTNTAELNEAIHAMYKWYAHADLCIIHLAGSSSLANFEDEPWFKRGWTLQELLAPRRIKFFDKEWRPFTSFTNDKDDKALMSTLWTVTGIPRDVIVADNSHGIRGHGVWEIMSWAAARKTTRIEDAAYCLYGLFGVHPPIAYGEGEKAFPRLVEAIVERYRTWDVFAWSGEPSEKHPALPSSPACYPRSDEAMLRGEVGMMEFTLMPHGMRLTSVPLVPMVFASKAKNSDGESFTVTLSPRSHSVTVLGKYSEVIVTCGSRRLPFIHDATDLHVCILNYKPSPCDRRGELQYLCNTVKLSVTSSDLHSRTLDGMIKIRQGKGTRLRILMSPATYHLFSTLEGELNVGVWLLLQQQPKQLYAVDQPVRLGVDLAEWMASPEILNGGPTSLSVGPYQYTCNRDGVVFATNQASLGQIWFLFVTDDGFRIATDLRGNMVWTAGAPREAIKIKSFRPGEPSQVFKFVKEK